MSDRKSLRVRRLGLFGTGSGGALATVRLFFAASGSLGLVFACSVVDKGDYEFDGIGDSGAGGSGKGGSSGNAGASGKGGSGGKAGSSGDAGAGQGESGAGNEGGSAAVGASGASGQGAEAGASEGGTAGIAASGGMGAEGGMGPGECGDDTLNTGEDCDDGNTDTETCSYGDRSCSVCNSQCELVAGAVHYCGDGRIDTDDGENCDDRNDVSEVCGYGVTSCTVCGSTCTQDVGDTSYCGDGERDAQFGEECDRGAENSTAPNACRPSCKNPSCGDRVRDDNEACDDGNHNPGDGCTPDCKWEPRPSCKHFLMTGGNLPDGNYPLDLDGPMGEPPFPGFCDMTTDGGGWTLTYKISNNVPFDSDYWWNQTLPGYGTAFPNQPTPITVTFEGPSMEVRSRLATNSGALEWRATQISSTARLVDVKSSYIGVTGNLFRCFATGQGACTTSDQTCSPGQDAYVIFNSASEGVLPTGSWGYLCDVGWTTCQGCVDWSAVSTTMDAGSTTPQNSLVYAGDNYYTTPDTTVLYWIR